MESVDVFTLVGNPPGWNLVPGSNQLSVRYDLNVISTFKAFAKLFWYVWQERNPVASLGPRQWFILYLNAHSCWYAVWKQIHACDNSGG